jgi:hypothetical protein
MLATSSRFLPLVAIVLGACAPLPTGPGVLAIPGTGKSLTQFETDDAECRQYATARLPSGDRPIAESYDVQRRYDFAYLQCMYSKGHKVPVPADYTGGAAKPPPAPPPAPSPPSPPPTPQ